MTPNQFEILYNRYHKSLVYLANRLVGKMYGEDIVEEAFLKVLEMGDEFKYEPGGGSGFLYQHVKNRCLDFIKVRKGRLRIINSMPPIEISDEYADNSIIKAELLRLLTERIESLSPERKKMFDFLFIHQLKPKEIALLTNLSENTIRVHKMRLTAEFKIFESRLFHT